MRIGVLDHGFVELVETYGSDERIIEAARESTDKGFLGWGPKHRDGCVPGMGGNYDECSCGRNQPGDEKLLRYLYEHKHSTPFEFAGAVVRVQAPIFVFREWHRHRTQSYAEISSRYTPLPDLNYIPTVERLMLGGGHLTKQAGTVDGAQSLTREEAEVYRGALETMYDSAQALYTGALMRGVPKELARVHLPVGRYSRMRAAANLRNWLAFLTLRQAPNAQWEIRQFANVLHSLLAERFPRTLALFDEKGVGP